MRRILLWPNLSKKNIREISANVAQILISNHADVIAPQSAAGIFSGFDGIRIMPEEDAVTGADLAVVLGGDGSMLHIAEKAAKNALPLLGVNLGKIGFITELEPREIGLISNVFEGRYQIDRRMMLDVTVLRGDESFALGPALNDVVATHGNILRLVDIGVFCDNHLVTSFSGDGVVISTPTGSTAYSMAAGGPIIEPSAENITITPICAHALYAKSFVLSADRAVKVNTYNAFETSAMLAVDGRNSTALLEGDDVIIGKSSYETRLIRLKGNNYYNVLNQKLSDRRRTQ